MAWTQTQTVGRNGRMGLKNYFRQERAAEFGSPAAWTYCNAMQLRLHDTEISYLEDGGHGPIGRCFA